MATVAVTVPTEWTTVKEASRLAFPMTGLFHPQAEVGIDGVLSGPCEVACHPPAVSANS